MDPKRLLETESDDQAALLERELLSSLRPPESARGVVWQRMARSGLIALGVSGTMGATSKVAAASAALSPKLALVLVVAAPLVGGAVYFARAQASAPRAAATAAAPAPVPSAALVPPANPSPTPKAITSDEPLPERIGARPGSPAAALAEENRLLREAREALRSGDAARSLGLLQRLDARFPHGALLQERELLRVQALRGAGQSAEAEARARRFLKLYPESPYAEHVTRLVTRGAIPDGGTPDGGRKGPSDDAR